MQMIC